ncbi:MAG: hypothetical protein R3E84_14415 [Pseudomonadales bacterium]
MHPRPYFPTQTKPVFFAISADDVQLYFEPAELNARQRVDDQENKNLISMLQVGSLFLGKPGDRVALYEKFREAPWAAYLHRWHGLFERMGLDPVHLADAHYFPRDDFYGALPPLRSDELLTVYMVSGSNRQLHDDDFLSVSRRVNSKMVLAQEAAGYGIPVPATLVTTRAGLGGAEVAAFLSRHGPEVMLKVMGLAGARNVTRVSSVQAAKDWVADLKPEEPVLLQEKLDLRHYAEMTVDLFVSDAGVHIDNMRKILFANGLWVGNYIRGGNWPTAGQREELLRVGDFVRAEGFCAPEGLNCGIDYFVPTSGEDRVVVTELNARFTGGLMPAEVVRRLDLGGRDTVVCFATVGRDRLEDYLTFNEHYLYGNRNAAFATLPLGFSPYTATIEGREMVFVWQMVWGDFAAAVAAKNAELGPSELGVFDLIDLESVR